MKMKSLIVSVFSAFVLLSSCGGNTDVVDSGTYTGKIKKVKPEETEIYVTIDQGKELELYFTDETTLTKNGNDVEFSELSKGQKVKVEVKKVGKRLDPLAVEILE